MNHDERWSLAEAIAHRMAANYPVVVAGVVGSAAQGTDTPYSDLDTLFVLADGSEMKSRYFLYRGTAVGVNVIVRGELETILTAPTIQWPYWMGVLNTLKVLHGDPDRVRAWLNKGLSVPIEQFHALLEAELPGLVVESYGRILSCVERGDTADIHVSVVETLLEMNLALCLLNKGWVTHDYYQGIVDACRFSKLPAGYAELAPALWTAHDADEIVSLAKTLHANYWRLLKDEGIRVDDYSSPDELPL